VAASRVGRGELSLACSPVTAKSSRSCYIVSMPTNLHRCYGAGYSHFITTSCYQRRPLLGTPRYRDLFLEVMEQIRQRHQFVVVGYVVMPEHVHLLFTEPERGNPSLVLAALKQTFAHRLLRELPEEWLWSSFRHYAYGERGPVLVNETRKAELHIRKIS
jgi:REP element-mobilizing transposase RayT